MHSKLALPTELLLKPLTHKGYGETRATVSSAVSWDESLGFCSSRHTASLSFLQDLKLCQKLHCATVACTKPLG